MSHHRTSYALRAHMTLTESIRGEVREDEMQNDGESACPDDRVYL